MKKNEILPSPTVWMDLQDILLSEMGQRKKNAVWFYLHMESKKQKPDTRRY